MKRSTWIMAALALLLVGGGQARAEQLVVNGGFENSGLAGWTQSGPLQVVGGYAHSGSYSLEFSGFLNDDGSGYGTISQTLSTTAGASYTLDFWLMNLGGPGSGDDFQAYWDGALVVDVLKATSFPYTEYTYQVTASSDATVLEFTGYNDQSAFVLDDVSVTDDTGDPPPAAPEPASLTLGGIGLLGLLGYGWRRRKLALKAA